ncbi:Transcriptional regulator, XRE family [Desulfosarcina cetonica]|uniref:helix-turn-helix domain-containing protein n=1 Tax=Desulfosarcina cetonica TaxID=90730 RepID=UPI0006D00E90|nr:XRE family transcriptional regulator [Desulfosarcina cetonica]VTR64329.1 Transcriptional regulator, XRE family [Desulfosarcina cetonica]
MDTKASLPHINVDYFEELTGEIPASDPTGVSGIGDRIQALRKEKGFSIEELSKITGFTTELLSKIETREVMPQLGTVMKLSKALEAAIGGLISGEGDKPYAIMRMGEQKTISRSTAQGGQQQLYIYKGLAAEVKGRHMEPLLVKLTESAQKETSQHDGEEFIYVLQGTVVLEIGSERHELSPGDSVYYSSTTPHWLTAKSDTATILAVLYNQ